MKETVLVIQEQVPPYRVPFFESLARELERRDLDLRVASSSVLPGVEEIGFVHELVSTSRGGVCALETIRRHNPKALVLPHDARFALLGLATRAFRLKGPKQLFWGMGIARRYCLTATPNGYPFTAASHSGTAFVRTRHRMAEDARRLMLSTCDHYLSYTELSTMNLTNYGYDGARITTLNNAVEALATFDQVAKAQRVPFQALFVASLVEDKEPLAAVSIVNRARRRVPQMTLHIVGDGRMRAQCEEAAERTQWITFHGIKRGPALRDLALTSDVAIIPGRVGLAVLEMFSAGLPLATYAKSLHGAEISYLKDGINGIFLNEDLDTAAKEFEALLTDRPTLERMRHEALNIADQYTIGNMAANFADGVIKAL